MEIAVFSNKISVNKYFSKIEKNKKYSVKYYEVNSYKKEINKNQNINLVYLDIEDLDELNFKRIISYLSKIDKFAYAVIDRKKKIVDIAEIFFKGASDYIDAKLFKEGLQLSRIKKIIEFKKIIIAENIKKSSTEFEESSAVNLKLSGKDWKNIKSGQEYTFCLMYVNFDSYNKIGREYSYDHANHVLQEFQNSLAEYINPIHGRLWMWMEAEGLIIFPFNGRDCPAILTCFKFLLNKALISAEKKFRLLISYKIALHIGDTVYQKKGNTGTIISESINSIFHLGQKYAEKDSFILTENVVKYIPEEIKEYFKSAGSFEGRKITRMLKMI